MSSENLGLVAVGVALFAINAFLGAPIASRIARFFGRVLPADSRKVSGATATIPPERPSAAKHRPAESRS
jgi:hypothetical protein